MTADEKAKIDSPLFPLGKIEATPGSFVRMSECGASFASLLARHASGDWGDCDAEDRAANDAAVLEMSRVFSSYTLTGGRRVWVITEADRSATRFLLPDEY